MATGTAADPEPFLPRELTSKCNMLVEKCHKDLGWQSLQARVVTKTNMVALACLDSRMMTVLKETNTAWKLRIACWVASALLLVFAWIFSWWLLLGVVVAVPLERKYSALEKCRWMFMSSVLLSLEMLANDIAGWGTAYPAERIHAIELLGPQPTEWLDFYLPRRANIDAATMKRFGPAGLE